MACSSPIDYPLVIFDKQAILSGPHHLHRYKVVYKLTHKPDQMDKQDLYSFQISPEFCRPYREHPLNKTLAE
jgi:hypothetical protein